MRGRSCAIAMCARPARQCQCLNYFWILGHRCHRRGCAFSQNDYLVEQRVNELSGEDLLSSKH